MRIMEGKGREIERSWSELLQVKAGGIRDDEVSLARKRRKKRKEEEIGSESWINQRSSKRPVLPHRSRKSDLALKRSVNARSRLFIHGEGDRSGNEVPPRGVNSRLRDTCNVSDSSRRISSDLARARRALTEPPSAIVGSRHVQMCHNFGSRGRRRPPGSPGYSRWSSLRIWSFNTFRPLSVTPQRRNNKSPGTSRAKPESDCPVFAVGDFWLLSKAEVRRVARVESDPDPWDRRGRFRYVWPRLTKWNRGRDYVTFRRKFYRVKSFLLIFCFELRSLAVERYCESTETLLKTEFNREMINLDDFNRLN